MLVLVTRPQPAADRTAQKLAKRGHEPLVAPLMSIERTQVPMPDGEFDAIVFTSENALIAFDDPPFDVPVLTVGDRTAQAAREMGFRDVRSASRDRHALALLASETLPPAQRLLVVAGRDRKEDTDALLHQAGHEVVVWEAYAALAADALPSEVHSALAGRSMGAILHYSRRSAAICLKLATAAGLGEAFLAARHLCLSDDCAEPLVASGASTIEVAEEPDESSVLALL